MTALTPEKLGLYEVKYLEILDKVLTEFIGCDMTVEESKEDIVLAYGKAIKRAVEDKIAEDQLAIDYIVNNEQTEGEVLDGSN